MANPSEEPIVKAPIALVTTFGLARTPAQIGMLNSLAEREIPFDYAVGTSLGFGQRCGVGGRAGHRRMRDFWVGWRRQSWADRCAPWPAACRPGSPAKQAEEIMSVSGVPARRLRGPSDPSASGLHRP